MWVGLELATLITVVMVGLYRTPQAIEAAWKYFILASVGISLAFFGTILIYLAGQPALGEGVPAMTWSLLQAAAARMDPAHPRSRLHLPADRLRHQGRPRAAARLAARCAMPRARRRSRRFCRACC